LQYRYKAYCFSFSVDTKSLGLYASVREKWGGSVGWSDQYRVIASLTEPQGLIGKERGRRKRMGGKLLCLLK